MTAASRGILARCVARRAQCWALVLLCATPASAAGGELTASPQQLELSVPVALNGAEAEVTVRNRGAPLTITRELVTDAFRVTRRPSYPLVVPSGGEFVLRVAFRARAEGRVTGRLALYAGGIAAPVLIVPLTGSAGPPGLEIAPAEALEFPAVAVGSRSLGIGRLLTNAGLSRLDIGRIAIEGAAAADFQVVPVGAHAELGPDDSTTLEIVFAPSAPGARGAELVISSNDPTAPERRIALSGTGMATATPVDPVPAAAR